MRTTLLTVSLLASLALPGAASAQMTYTIQSFGEPERPSGTLLYGTMAPARPIGRDECVENLEIPLDIANIRTSDMGKVFGVYSAAVGSGMCNVGTNRNTPAGGTPICTHTDFPAPMITPPSMTLRPTIQQLFGAAACDTETTTDREFWFLALTSDPDISSTVEAGSYVVVRVLLDTAPPTPPTVADSPAGDTEIAVTFDANTAEGLSGATAYVDATGCDASGNVLETTTLVAGAAPPSSGDSVTTTGTEAVTLDGAELGLVYGQYAAVAVTTFDLARNESVLSNVVCVQRVELSGFWDAYCAERDMDPAMCRTQYGCAASPGTGRAGLVVALFGVALAFLTSRRARRSSR